MWEQHHGMSAHASVSHPTEMWGATHCTDSPDLTVHCTVTLYCTLQTPPLTLIFSPELRAESWEHNNFLNKLSHSSENITKVRWLRLTCLCLAVTTVIFIIAPQNTEHLQKYPDGSIIFSLLDSTILIFWVRKPWQIHLEEKHVFIISLL